MSYFDEASLVMIPSGYKEDKIYSIKPTDGSGDLTFSRSNDTATRVNSDGLIEKVRTNLAAYSSDFSQQYNLLNATISTNTTTDPFGTSLADSHLETATNSTHASYYDYTVASGVELTYSMYAKSIGGRNIRILGDSGFSGAAVVDLSNGTLLAGSTADAKVTSAGNGWYRISITATTTTTTARILVYSVDGTSASFLGDITKGIFVFGRQLEYGVATDYIATTTAAASVGPVANLPRLDYLDSSCPKLLLEPQRTNLVTYSEQFDNAVWAKSLCTITSNQIVSPSGYLDADLVTTSGAADTLQQSVSVTSGTAYTFSGFIKSGSTDTIDFVVYGSLTTSVGTYNLTNGTATSGTGSPVVSIQDYGNGWYRATLTATATSTGTANFYFGSGSTDAISTYHVWGAQLESGAYATSYIPTLSAAVTRGADAAYKTGISSLIGQTEGTLFADFVYDGDFQHRFNVAEAGSSNNWIFMSIPESANGNGRVYIKTNSSTHLDTSTGLGSGTFVKGQRYKAAFAYKSGDWAIYINGVLKSSGSDTFTAPSPNFDGFYPSGTSPLSGSQVQLSAVNFNQNILFKTRLSNAELESLTTL